MEASPLPSAPFNALRMVLSKRWLVTGVCTRFGPLLIWIIVGLDFADQILVGQKGHAAFDGNHIQMPVMRVCT